jgi:hypothetical protein
LKKSVEAQLFLYTWNWAATEEATMKRIVLGFVAVVVGVFVLTCTASAFAQQQGGGAAPAAGAGGVKTTAGGGKEEGYGYEFSDDPLSAGGFGPNDATIRVRPGPVRTTLIRPRTSFVPEMLKSVENL